MDIKQTLSNVGRKISEAKLPYIGDGKQRDMPTYDLTYNGLMRNPILGPKMRSYAALGPEALPYLLSDNVYDTVVNGLPNVYNWAVDEYNAGASRRALNNYINNEGKEAREKIQRRQNQTMSAPITRRVLQTVPNNATAEQVQQVVAQNNEALGRMEKTRRLEAKSKIVGELGRLRDRGELFSDLNRTMALIDLYNKVK